MVSEHHGRYPGYILESIQTLLFGEKSISGTEKYIKI